MHEPKPLSPAKATEAIRRKIGQSTSVAWTQHAKEQMAERDLIMGDVIHVLKYGFVLEEGQPSTQTGLFKYRMQGTTPNSGGRLVCVVVIPTQACAVKIVTVMWVDEDRMRS